MNQQSAFIKEYSRLIGKTVASLVVDNHDASSEVVGLKFSDGTLAWIECDPEGNGPGFLRITKSKVKI